MVSTNHIYLLNKSFAMVYHFVLCKNTANREQKRQTRLSDYAEMQLILCKDSNKICQNVTHHAENSNNNDNRRGCAKICHFGAAPFGVLELTSSLLLWHTAFKNRFVPKRRLRYLPRQEDGRTRACRRCRLPRFPLEFDSSGIQTNNPIFSPDSQTGMSAPRR